MENETVKDKLDVVERLLDEYERGLHLDQFSIKEVDFDGDIQKIKTSLPEDIYNILLDWSYYVVGLQKQLNKHKSRFTWAKSNLNILLIRESPKYNGFNYTERRDQALGDNSFALALYKLMDQSEIAINRLEKLVERIDYMKVTAQELLKNKKYKNREFSHD